MKPTHKILDSLKIIIPGSYPSFIGVNVDFFLLGIQELNNVILPFHFRNISVA